MINPEKFFEMLDPSRAFATVGQGKVFDVEKQGELVASHTGQACKLVGLYQAGTRRAVEFCLGQSEAALKASREFANEWASTVTQVTSELVNSVQEDVQEATGALEPPKTPGSAKAG